jgi:hypothetical protein
MLELTHQAQRRDDRLETASPEQELYSSIIARYDCDDIDGAVLPAAILEADQIIDQCGCDGNPIEFYRNVLLLANGVRFKSQPLDTIGESIDCLCDEDRECVLEDLRAIV